MRILLAAFLLPAVVAFKTCVVDAPCDVCGPEEALFPIASSPFADLLHFLPAGHALLDVLHALDDRGSTHIESWMNPLTFPQVG